MGFVLKLFIHTDTCFILPSCKVGGGVGGGDRGPPAFSSWKADFILSRGLPYDIFFWVGFHKCVLFCGLYYFNGGRRRGGCMSSSPVCNQL